MADALGDVYAIVVINFYNGAFEDLEKIGLKSGRDRGRGR
jgi:hypothetical protein